MNNGLVRISKEVAVPNSGTILSSVWRNWWKVWSNSWYPVSWPRFELNTSWIHIWNITSSLTFEVPYIQGCTFLLCLQKVQDSLMTFGSSRQHGLKLYPMRRCVGHCQTQTWTQWVSCSEAGNMVAPLSISMKELWLIGGDRRCSRGWKSHTFMRSIWEQCNTLTQSLWVEHVWMRQDKHHSESIRK
jgi:hypothetical protein